MSGLTDFGPIKNVRGRIIYDNYYNITLYIVTVLFLKRGITAFV